MPFIREVLEQNTGETAASPDSESDRVEVKKEPVDPRRDEKSSLHVPEGIELILGPLTCRMARKPWKRQRAGPGKPLPARPGPCLQTPNNYLRVPAKQLQPEAPSTKATARVPRLIQPAPMVQHLSGVRHLSLQPAVGTSGRLELQGVLSAQRSSPCLTSAAPQNFACSVPAPLQPKMLLPSLRARKPGALRGFQKKKGPRAAPPLLKTAPLLHPAPVIFTVPAAAVKVVGLSNGCNVLQPLAATTGRTAQPIPITTLLVNSAPFPCPLSQPLATPPPPSLIVPSNPTGFPTSGTVTEADFGSHVACGLSAGAAKPVCRPLMEPKLQEPSLCSAIATQEEGHGALSPDSDRGQGEAAVKAGMEEAAAVELVTQDPFALTELGERVKVDAEEPIGIPQPVASPSEKPSSSDIPTKEELILDFGQELDVKATPEQKEISPASKGRSPGVTGQCPEGAGAEGTGHCSPNTSSPAAVETESDSPLAKPEDLPSLAGHEVAGDKNGLEEEEEEDDFDDFTQDDEDEEMSSASEESVLSVPELQVTPFLTKKKKSPVFGGITGRENEGHPFLRIRRCQNVREALKNDPSFDASKVGVLHSRCRLENCLR